MSDDEEGESSYQSKYDISYSVKFIIVGDSSVGKSNILLRFSRNVFDPGHQATLGIEFANKHLIYNNTDYLIQIWDTAGQENFRSITRAYYKNSVCALIVYDITNRSSFENIISWIEDCKGQSPKSIFIILVGNKNDLENERQVSYEEGLEFAKNNNIVFFETSAKTGKNISELFQTSAIEINKKIEEDFYDLENESCGIKIGNIDSNNNNSYSIDGNYNNISLDLSDKKNTNDNDNCC